MRETIFRVITDERMLLLITGISVFWRVFVNLDEQIKPWESFISGLSLFIMGWILFGYMYAMSQKPTRWPVSSKSYQGISITLLVLNSYVLTYYAMRWFGSLHVEVVLPLDPILRNVRFVMFVMFYCAIIWSAKYLKKMHEDYRFLLSRSKKRGSSMRESLFTVITDDRTLLVMIGIAFLWRTLVSFDYTVTFWESTCQYITQLIIGWFLFGYISALSVKARDKLDLIKVIQGISVALCTINIYALVYYGLSWYSLVVTGDFDVAFTPLDFFFRDLRFFALVLFYYTVIMLSKVLDKACADYIVPIKMPSGS